MIARLSFGQALVAVALVLAAGLAAAAQPAEQSSSAMQGISMNRDQPVKIEANTLEVRDKIRQATFSGDVKLTQGDTTLKCKTLVVFYEDTAAPKKGGPQAQKGGGLGGQQQIKRAEARGDVFVTQKDQTASGEMGVFDLKTNTVTMTGNVVVTQGQTVMRGERMVVDLTSGVTKVGGGRVELLAQPSAKDGKLGMQPAPPPTKSPPRAPVRIN
jgi:lipopolysaccharide export system protein LptA